jgi:hypothetical protein
MSFNFKKALRDGIKSSRPYTYKIKKESYHKDTETKAREAKVQSDKSKETNNE